MLRLVFEAEGEGGAGQFERVKGEGEREAEEGRQTLEVGEEVLAVALRQGDADFMRVVRMRRHHKANAEAADDEEDEEEDDDDEEEDEEDEEGKCGERVVEVRTAGAGGGRGGVQVRDLPWMYGIGASVPHGAVLRVRSEPRPDAETVGTLVQIDPAETGATPPPATVMVFEGAQGWLRVRVLSSGEETNESVGVEGWMMMCAGGFDLLAPILPTVYTTAVEPPALPLKLYEQPRRDSGDDDIDDNEDDDEEEDDGAGNDERGRVVLCPAFICAFQQRGDWLLVLTRVASRTPKQGAAAAGSDEASVGTRTAGWVRFRRRRRRGRRKRAAHHLTAKAETDTDTDVILAPVPELDVYEFGRALPDDVQLRVRTERRANAPVLCHTATCLLPAIPHSSLAGHVSAAWALVEVGRGVCGWMRIKQKGQELLRRVPISNSVCGERGGAGNDGVSQRQTPASTTATHTAATTENGTPNRPHEQHQERQPQSPEGPEQASPGTTSSPAQNASRTSGTNTKPMETKDASNEEGVDAAPRSSPQPSSQVPFDETPVGGGSTSHRRAEHPAATTAAQLTQIQKTKSAQLAFDDMPVGGKNATTAATASSIGQRLTNGHTDGTEPIGSPAPLSDGRPASLCMDDIPIGTQPSAQGNGADDQTEVGNLHSPSSSASSASSSALSTQPIAITQVAFDEIPVGGTTSVVAFDDIPVGGKNAHRMATTVSAAADAVPMGRDPSDTPSPASSSSSASALSVATDTTAATGTMATSVVSAGTATDGGESAPSGKSHSAAQTRGLGVLELLQSKKWSCRAQAYTTIRAAATAATAMSGRQDMPLSVFMREIAIAEEEAAVEGDSAIAGERVLQHIVDSAALLIVDTNVRVQEQALLALRDLLQTGTLVAHLQQTADAMDPMITRIAKQLVPTVLGSNRAPVGHAGAQLLLELIRIEESGVALSFLITALKHRQHPKVVCRAMFVARETLAPVRRNARKNSDGSTMGDGGDSRTPRRHSGTAGGAVEDTDDGAAGTVDVMDATMARPVMLAVVQCVESAKADVREAAMEAVLHIATQARFFHLWAEEHYKANLRQSCLALTETLLMCAETVSSQVKTRVSDAMVLAQARARSSQGDSSPGVFSEYEEGDSTSAENMFDSPSEIDTSSDESWALSSDSEGDTVGSIGSAPSIIGVGAGWGAPTGPDSSPHNARAALSAAPDSPAIALDGALASGSGSKAHHGGRGTAIQGRHSLVPDVSIGEFEALTQSKRWIERVRGVNWARKCIKWSHGQWLQRMTSTELIRLGQVVTDLLHRERHPQVLVSIAKFVRRWSSVRAQTPELRSFLIAIVPLLVDRFKELHSTIFPAVSDALSEVVRCVMGLTEIADHAVDAMGRSNPNTKLHTVQWLGRVFDSWGRHGSAPLELAQELAMRDGAIRALFSQLCACAQDRSRTVRAAAVVTLGRLVAILEVVRNLVRRSTRKELTEALQDARFSQHSHLHSNLEEPSTPDSPFQHSHSPVPLSNSRNAMEIMASAKKEWAESRAAKRRKKRSPFEKNASRSHDDESDNENDAMLHTSTDDEPTEESMHMTPNLSGGAKSHIQAEAHSANHQAQERRTGAWEDATSDSRSPSPSRTLELSDSSPELDAPPPAGQSSRPHSGSGTGAGTGGKHNRRTTMDFLEGIRTPSPGSAAAEWGEDPGAALWSAGSPAAHGSDTLNGKSNMAVAVGLCGTGATQTSTSARMGVPQVDFWSDYGIMDVDALLDLCVATDPDVSRRFPGGSTPLLRSDRSERAVHVMMDGTPLPPSVLQMTDTDIAILTAARRSRKMAHTTRRDSADGHVSSKVLAAQRSERLAQRLTERSDSTGSTPQQKSGDRPSARGVDLSLSSSPRSRRAGGARVPERSVASSERSARRLDRSIASPERSAHRNSSKSPPSAFATASTAASGRGLAATRSDLSGRAVASPERSPRKSDRSHSSPRTSSRSTPRSVAPARTSPQRSHSSPRTSPRNSPTPIRDSDKPYAELQQFLERAKLECFYETFRENLITLDVVKTLTDDEYDELSIPMGAKKRIRMLVSLGMAEDGGEAAAASSGPGAAAPTLVTTRVGGLLSPTRHSPRSPLSSAAVSSPVASSHSIVSPGSPHSPRSPLSPATGGTSGEETIYGDVDDDTTF